MSTFQLGWTSSSLVQGGGGEGAGGLEARAAITKQL